MPCSLSVCAVENSSTRALVEIVSKDKCTEHDARAQNPVVGHGRAWNQPGHGRLKRKSMDKSQSQFSIEIHDTQAGYGVRQPPAALPCFAGEEFGQCKWHTSSVRTKFSFDRKKRGDFREIQFLPFYSRSLSLYTSLRSALLLSLQSTGPLIEGPPGECMWVNYW